MATTAAPPNPTTSAPRAPQLKACQAGREDGRNAFNYSFGPPAQPHLLDHYTEHHAATLHFPDAYKGTSVRIRDTITNLITENVQNFLTTVIAPWRRQDNPNISCVPARARPPALASPLPAPVTPLTDSLTKPY